MSLILDPNKSYCPICRGLFTISKMIFDKETGLCFCSKCFKASRGKCTICSKEICNVSAPTFGTKFYCKKCWEERFSICRGCNRAYRKDDLFDEGGGNYYCNKCWSKIGAVHDYSYVPKLKFNLLDEEQKVKSVLFMGIELEVAHPEEDEQKIGKKFKKFLQNEKIESHYYLKHDHSVHGFEIVTHPFTLKYGLEKMKFKEILIWLKEQDFYCENCGLHIHIDRKFFETNEIIFMRMFMSCFKKQIFILSKREDENNEFCRYENFNSVEYFLRSPSQKGRHWAFNVKTNKDTSEIRVFKGTLKYNVFRTALEFAQCLSDFSKECDINLFKLRTRKKVIWDKFVRKAKSSKKYEYLVNLMIKEKLCV
jgi:hypothetical protein